MVDTDDHETPNGQSVDEEDDSPLFEWDDANIEHIGRHNVHPIEAEEALLSGERLPIGRRTVDSELRWAFVGSSESGRLLSVVYCKRSGRIRVISARDASVREFQQFRRYWRNR